MRKNFLVLNFIFALFSLRFTLACFAEEITVLCTGQTHAMLYTCSCPVETDGGVARRAALIKELRQSNPDALLLDSGEFFAGGKADEYSVNSELDSQRTIINLKAMDLMGYDAVAVGNEEFNFGRKFLDEQIAGTKIPFISCNIKSDKFQPYIIKEVKGIKVAIIGVSSLSTMDKAEGLKVVNPKIALPETIAQVRQKGADFIILLSQLGENEDINLLKEIKGINAVIVSPQRSEKDKIERIGDTLILRPLWQGRRMLKCTFSFADKKVKDYKAEEIRLSDKIKDDPEILAFLPQCFSDANCRRKGFIASCLAPGTMGAQCKFTEPNKVNLQVIASKDAVVSDTQRVVNFLSGQFPGLTVSYLYYPDPKAQSLIKDCGVKTLPVYLLNKDIEKEAKFDNLKENLELKGSLYMLKPQFSGITFFLDRKRKEGQLDVFISLYDKGTAALVSAIKDFRPNVHFLASFEDERFNAYRGNLEVEDCLRAVCVQKYYPEAFWDYLICRSGSINSSWWEDCLNTRDTNKIKVCARGEEGKVLLKENIGLNKEIQVMLGPAYLMNNQEVFGIEGNPTKEELKKIFKKE